MSERRGRFSKPPVNKLWESPGRRLAGQPLYIPREEFWSLGRYVPDNPQGKFNPLKFLVVSAAAKFFTPPRVEGPTSLERRCPLAGCFFAVGQFIDLPYQAVCRGDKTDNSAIVGSVLK